jgi:hypothetical protein
MSNKIFFREKWGGAFWLLLLLALLAQAAPAQDICLSLPCSALAVEVAKVENNSSNLNPNCPTSPGACGSDGFRQMAFKVFLRYSKASDPNDPATFFLDYSKLDVHVRLRDNQAPQFSSIDATATNNCFINGTGANWHNYSNPNGDKVVFTPTKDEVSISFANIMGADPCGATGQNGTGNKIMFSDASLFPLIAACSTGLRCWYAELFTVVVNAYAGEALALELGTAKYEPHSASSCQQLGFVNTGTGFINTTLNKPGTYVGTPNESLEAFLQTKEPVQDGGYLVPVAVKNTGMAAKTVSYAEFVLKVTKAFFDDPLSFEGATPTVIGPFTGQQQGSSDYYLHYAVHFSTPLSLPAGNGTAVIGKVKIGPPTLINQSWGFSAAFAPDADRFRVKTPQACTSLKTVGGGQSESVQGDNPYSDPSVRFKVSGVSDGCGDLRVRVALYESPQGQGTGLLRLGQLKFRLRFDFDSPDIAFQSVDYVNWPSLTCADEGCATLGNPRACHNYDPVEKTFYYCAAKSHPSDYVFFTSSERSRYLDIVFANTGKGCITGVTVYELAMTPTGLQPAIPKIDPSEGFSLCANAVRGTVKTYLGAGVEEVTIKLREADHNPVTCPVTCTQSCAESTMLTDANGAYSYCDVCPYCDRFLLKPEKDDNPLNGVTTYDLVLISKHILGSEPFDSPFKMIAADANKSNSITTFDIAELRKLILGIYDVLPNNTSWRFVDGAFQFPNMNNPFQTSFPESRDCVAPQASTVNFVAVKVGDVNNTAQAHRPGPRPEASLSWPSLRAAPGSAVTVPVTYTGEVPMEAVQLGMRFDPGALRFIGASQGDIESWLPGNFNLLKAGEGEIKALWLPLTGDGERVMPGTVLFCLSFEALAGASEGGLPLSLDPSVLDCAGWSPDGTEHALRQGAALAERAGLPEAKAGGAGLRVSAFPNPSAGSAIFEVEADRAGKARLMLFDGFGQRVAFREFVLAAGRQQVGLAGTEGLPRGAYRWKLVTAEHEAQGQLILLGR